MNEKQELISRGEISVEGRYVDASNATLFANVTRGDQVAQVIYKPIAGERPLWDFPDGNLASREVAAYTLSNALGFDLVPYTILRDGPFGPGMVQEWIDIDPDFDVVELANSDHSKIREMALFDAIVNNTDRKYGHILVDRANSIFGCDHGVTFHVDPKLRTVIWQFAGQPFTEVEIAAINNALAAADSLHELITADEISALKARCDNYLMEGTFPFPSEDWPAVPWPPF